MVTKLKKDAKKVAPKSKTVAKTIAKQSKTAAKKTKLHTLTIDRRTWLRGRGSVVSRLRDKHGEQCCLGFAARDAGFKTTEIVGKKSPFMLLDDSDDGSLEFRAFCPSELKQAEDMMERLGPYSFLLAREDVQGVEQAFVGFTESPDCDELMRTNDDDGMTDREREKRIKSIFRKHGVEVVFVN